MSRKLKQQRKDDAENIKVIVRSRPLNQREIVVGMKGAVDLDLTEGTVTVNHLCGNPDRWTFDAVVNNTFAQRDVFVQFIQPMVDSVLDGFNATIFAYGQSGSGKTYTMTGGPEDLQGIIPRSFHYVFNHIKERRNANIAYTIRCSFLELYNGKIRDLLAKNQVTLNIKESKDKTFYVHDLSQPEVKYVQEMMQLMEEGTFRRQVAATELNTDSSRSHSIFTVCIEMVETTEEGDCRTVTSKLNLVDLAGSERQSKTRASGDTLKEGCNINLSLSALGTVIDTLVKGKGHVPYRSSALTMLLKDSLGGNSKTVMFANVGPADMNVAETISTLRFADRAKQIENKPVKNLDPKDQHIADLKAQVEELKKRLARGGGGNLEAEERMREQIETLELERDQDRQAWERDKLDREAELGERAARNKSMMELVEKTQVELQQATDNHRVEANLVTGLRDELTETKRMIMDFFIRILPDNILSDSLDRLPKPPTPDDGSEPLWDRNTILAVMDAHQDWSKGSKGVSSEELQRKIDIEKAEWDAKTKQLQETLDGERAYFQEELQKERAQRTEETESSGKIKSELQAKEQEVVRLKEKITRDLDKFKQKLQTKQQDRDEMQAQLTAKDEELQEKIRHMQRLEESAKDQESSLESRIKERVAEAGTQHDKSMDEARRGWEARMEEIETEKAGLLNKINQMEIQMKQAIRRGLLVRKNQGDDKGDDDDDGDKSGIDKAGILDEGELEALDDSCINKDMFEELHIQVRLQCRLQRLRHLQQKQLDSLIDRYHKAAGDNRGKVTEEKMTEAVKKAVSEKETELEELRKESQKTQDKLVKRINKKLAEFQEMEQKLREELSTLEEENKELADMNERIALQHAQALETATTLKGLLEQRESDAETEKRRGQREVQQSKEQIMGMEGDMDDLRKQLSVAKASEEGYHDLKKEYELTKVSLRDQRAQVDAQRARLKSMEEMWQDEKARSEELRNQLEEARSRVEKTEQHYQEVVKEHGVKMSKLLHEKLEEQQQHYMDELHEQQLIEKAIKEKLKKARSITQKAKQKFDEMVLENEKLQTQFEEFKISAFRFHQESEQLQVEDNSSRIKDLIRTQQNIRKEQADAFTGRPSSSMGRGFM
eukprot:TRINITY_DN17801_c0_g1_i1.p1 TRINITY_DN17801_c0_g1~~TRINITY_DN17801_c0_g1_i1.p1  ORF type:complete len:1123 (+),score=622.39 TRINITY_DN17801_c0_g1_i1:230-3598(+)